MPTGDDYLLDAGADLTPTFGAHAAQITQALELAVPNSYRGVVIVSETTPTTTGQPSGYPTNWYAWQKRCLWYKTSTKELFAFDGTTWALVKATPANGSVGTAQLADGSVTIEKLGVGAGQQYQVQRINAAETGLEWIDAVELFGANEIAISKLSDSSVGYFVLTRNGPTKAWTQFDSATLLSLFGSNEIPVDYLAHGSALQVPMMNAGATAVAWSSVVASIADGALPLAKLDAVVADAGKYLRRNPITGVVESVALAAPSTPNIQQVTNEITSLPAAGAATNSAHGLATIPTFVTGFLVCVTADAGYAVGDVVELSSIGVTGISGSYNYAGGYFFSFDGTNVTLTANDAATRKILHKANGSQQTFTTANWKFRYTATRYY